MSFRGGGGFNNSGGGGNFNNRGSGGGGNFNRGGGGGGNFNRGGGGGAPRGGYGDGQIQGGDEFTNLLSNLMNAPPAESGKVLPFPVKNDSGSSVSNSSRVAADPYPRNSATASGSTDSRGAADPYPRNSATASGSTDSRGAADPYPRNSATASGSTDSRGAADPYPRNSATASGSTDSRGAADPYPRNSATASGPTDSRGASNWIPAPSRAEYQNAAPAPAVQQIPENRDIFEDQAPAVPKPYLYSRSEMLAHQPSENACPPSRDEFHDNGSNYDTLFPSSRPEVPIQQPPPVKLDDANSQGSAVPAPYRCVRFAPTVDPLSTSSHLMPQANIDTKPVEIPAEVKHSPTVEDSHNENDSQSSASDFVDHYAAYREVSRDGIYTNLLEVPADLEYSPLMIAVVKEIESLSPVLNAVKQSVSPTINAIYLVKKPGHETYARAKVLHVKGDRVSVFFIDFIVSGVVDVKHVKIFPNVSTWKMYPDHM